jgi:pimeloyl-ACP methyl ester carboxylesterase
VDDRRSPILIANGFAPFPLPLHVAIAYYRERGFEVNVVPFHLENKRDVLKYAKTVADAVTGHSKTGKVNLIGFSMGGVASLYALKRLGIAPRVATFVALGAPFRGATIATFGQFTGIFTKTSRQLAPKSAFLADLHKDPLPPGPRYVSIGGTDDWICPLATTRLSGAENYEGPFGHQSFLIDPAVHELIEEFLA